MTIEEIFNQNIRTLFIVDGIDETNEAIFTLYGILAVAIRQQAGNVVLTKAEIFWEHAGKKLGAYPVTLEPDLGYEGELDFMLSRDSVLSDHMEKVPATSTTPLCYKFSSWKDILSES